MMWMLWIVLAILIVLVGKYIFNLVYTALAIIKMRDKIETNVKIQRELMINEKPSKIDAATLKLLQETFCVDIDKDMFFTMDEHQEPSYQFATEYFKYKVQDNLIHFFNKSERFW